MDNKEIDLEIENYRKKILFPLGYKNWKITPIERNVKKPLSSTIYKTKERYHFSFYKSINRII